MVNAVKLLLQPPEITEVTPGHIARTLHALLAMMTIMIIGIMPIGLFFAARKLPAMLLMAGVLTANYLTFQTSRRGHVRLATTGYLLCLWAIAATYFFLAGGTLNASLSLFIAIIAMCTLFLGFQASMIASIATMSYLLGFIISKNAGISIPQLFPQTELVNLIVFAFSMVQLILPITLMHNQLRQTLTTAREQLDERLKAEDALRESENRYRLLIGNLPDSAVILFDHNLRFLLVDGPEVAKAGYSGEAMVGRTLREALPPAFAELAEPNMRAVLQGERFSAEIPFTDQIHLYRYLPVEDADGGVMYGMIVAQNVTVRKQLEARVQEHTNQLEQLVNERTRALKRANEQLELILNTTTDALAFIDPGGDVLVANPSFRSIFSTPGDQPIEDVLSSSANDEETGSIGEALSAVMRERERRQLQTKIVAQNGREQYYDLTLIPVREDGRDNQHGVLLHAHDITHVKEMERFKARFIADALHDIATPITGLSTRLYLLERTPEKLADHVRALSNQLQHLQNLLADLRTLSLMDRGNITPERALCDVNNLVQRVYDTYEPVALDKQQTLTLRLDSTLPAALLDGRQIERVLVNLVSNAINYTAVQKAISIETQFIDQEIVIRITDQGIGIHPDEVPHIFGRFYRTDEARQNLLSGTGLGLAISKEIVEMHSGAISVVSEPGQGSTFIVRLPHQT